MATKNETNGETTTTATKAVTLLDKLDTEFKSLEKPVSKAEQKKCWDEYQRAITARDKAEEALAKCQKTASDAASAIVRARGKGSFTAPDGIIYFPMSKGDTVFFRGQSAEAPTFG